MDEAKAQAVEEQQVEGQEPEFQEEGQVNEERTEGNSLQEELRKWQSMYDKSQADNAKMQNAMTEYLKSQNTVQQTEVTQPNLTEDDFNPWDAYYKPDSPSYKMRTQSEQKLVHDVVDREISRLQSDMTMNNTRNELRQVHNMNDSDVNDFMSFVSKPKESVPIGSLVKLWRDSTGRSGNAANVAPPQTKQPTPRTAGTQSNQVPVRKSNESKAWESLLGASPAGRLP